MESSNYKFNNIDIVSGVCLIGGCVAAILTQKVVAAVLPLSFAVGMEIFNRQQELVKIQTQSQQESLRNKSKLEANLTTVQEQTVQNIKSLQEKGQHELIELSRQLEGVREGLIELSLEVQKLDLEQEQIRAIVDKFRKIQQLSQHIQSHTGSPEFYYERGLSYQQLNDLHTAIENFTQAIGLNSTYAEAYHSRGILYAQLDNRKRAIENLRQAAKLYFEQKNLEGYRQARTLYKELYDLRKSPNNQEFLNVGKIEAGQLFA